MRLLSARVVFRVVIVAALFPVFVPACHAQFSADYQTNIISGVVSNWAGDYVVGNANSADMLLIHSSGLLSNGYGYVGHDIGSSNNSVFVSDTGSVWSNVYELFVGYIGSRNSLVITNGGAVYSNHGALGADTVSSSNTVLVTGTNSVWSTGSQDVFVGNGGSGNSLMIANGGAVNDMNGWIGNFTSSHDNTVLVTGGGSVWSNGFDLAVGKRGSGNSLTIADGGAAYSTYGFLSTDMSNSNNAAPVTGEGSIWNNRLSLFVGFGGGTGNSLVVSNGGTVVTSNLVVGTFTTSCDDSVTVSGGNLFVTNAAHNAVLEVRRGTFTMNGGSVVADIVVVTNGCSSFVHSGGDLVIGTLVFNPALDVDGDGLPNGWEQSHGLDPLNPADGNADSDGDGFTNLQEYQAGTDPTNSASAFRILSVVPTNNDMLVSWTAGGGRTNVVQSATDLTGSYTNVSPNIILPGTGDVTTNYLDAGTATNAANRFYRIRLVP